MTRAPLTLLSLLPPTATITQRTPVCMCTLYVSWTAHSTAPRQKKLQGKGKRGEANLGESEEKWCGAAQHAWIKHLWYKCNGWLMGKVFVLKRNLPPLLFSTINFCITPSLWTNSVYPEVESLQLHFFWWWCRNVSLFSSNTGPGIGGRSNKVTVAVCVLYMESTLRATVLYGPLHNRNEYVCVHVKGRDVPVSTLFVAHGLSRNVKGRGGLRGDSEGRGQGSNLRGVSHSSDQHMVCTLHGGPSTQGEKHWQKRLCFQAWIERHNSFHHNFTDNSLMVITRSDALILSSTRICKYMPDSKPSYIHNYTIVVFKSVSQTIEPLKCDLICK